MSCEGFLTEASAYKLLIVLMIVILVPYSLSIDLIEERDSSNLYQIETMDNGITIAENHGNGVARYELNDTMKSVNITVEGYFPENSSAQINLRSSTDYPSGQIASFTTVQNDTAEIYSTKGVEYIQLALNRRTENRKPVVHEVSVSEADNRSRRVEEDKGVLADLFSAIF
jgi:hypothetical protein